MVMLSGCIDDISDGTAHGGAEQIRRVRLTQHIEKADATAKLSSVFLEIPATGNHGQVGINLMKLFQHIKAGKPTGHGQIENAGGIALALLDGIHEKLDGLFAG